MPTSLASSAAAPRGGAPRTKVPFVAEVSLDPAGHPLRAKLTPVPGFTLKAIAAWANAHLSPGSCVVSDGLACFVGVGEAGCQHLPIVVGGRKPKDLPDFHWVNTVLGNVKTSTTGAYHAFDFAKYAERYLGAIAYRFNRRFRLDTLPQRLLVAAVAIGPRREAWLRQAGTPCQSGAVLAKSRFTSLGNTSGGIRQIWRGLFWAVSSLQCNGSDNSPASLGPNESTPRPRRARVRARSTAAPPAWLRSVPSAPGCDPANSGCH